MLKVTTELQDYNAPLAIFDLLFLSCQDTVVLGVNTLVSYLLGWGGRGFESRRGQKTNLSIINFLQFPIIVNSNYCQFQLLSGQSRVPSNLQSRVPSNWLKAGSHRFKNRGDGKPREEGDGKLRRRRWKAKTWYVYGVLKKKFKKK